MKVYLFTILLYIGNVAVFVAGTTFEKIGQVRTNLEMVIQEIKANLLNILDVKNTL